MDASNLQLFDKVEKVTGDYHIIGHIVSLFQANNPQNRVKQYAVVEIRGWYGGNFLHVYNSKVLKLVERISFNDFDDNKTFKFDEQNYIETTTSDCVMFGYIASRFFTLDRHERYVVEHAASRGSFMHIYSPLNLRKVDNNEVGTS